MTPSPQIQLAHAPQNQISSPLLLKPSTSPASAFSSPPPFPQWQCGRNDLLKGKTLGESRGIGLNVSLTVSVRNGAETYVFISVPTGAAVLNAHGRRRRAKRNEQRGGGGQCEQHGRRGWRAQQAQNTGVSYSNAMTKRSYAAVVRSPPSPLQPRVTKALSDPLEV